LLGKVKGLGGKGQIGNRV